MAKTPESRRPIVRPGLFARAIAQTFSGSQLYVALAGLLALWLSALWPTAVQESTALVPAAGLSLVLVAWLGPRAGLVVLVAAILTSLGRWLVGAYEPGHGNLLLAEPLLATLEALVAWRLYHRVAHGARGLADPRSAFLFLLLAPGLVVGVGALVRALFAASAGADFADQLVKIWLGRALGIMAVTPALLTAVTPGLLRLKAVQPELVVAREAAVRGQAGTDPADRGDWIEIVGLAAGAGVLGLLLVLLASRQQLAGWQAWGGPLLLLLWASLRQGVRGGTLVAGAGAALPLLILPWLPALAPADLRLVQGNALTQCGVALLVAAATTWVRLSEARYRHIVTHVPVVIYSVRVVEPARGNKLPRSEMTIVSAASDVLLGCAPELLLGDPGRWLERVHPEDREILSAALAQLGRQVQPVTCEYRLAPRPDDPYETTTSHLLGLPSTPRQRARWVRDTMAPRFGPENVLIGWEGVVTDITEQRALADDLRRTTSMFHSLVSNLPTGVFFVHGPTAQPILVNARARQLLGQREDAAAGLEHLSEVYRLYRADGTPYPIEELPVVVALRSGSTTMCDDIVVHRPDGRRIPLVTWAAPLSLAGHGRDDAAVWVMEDLTALHQAEAARRETEGRLRTVEGDLQRAQRLELVGRLSSGIAHDFNNLLSVVLGLTELARASLPMDHPTQLDLLRITEAGEQAADLAKQLLTFSNNQRRSPSRRVEITRVIRRTLDLLRATLPAAIEVKLDLSSDELIVQGDETQLHQVVMNLCLNAREAMAEGGRLTVTAGSVHLPVSKTAVGKPRCWVQLTVRDEGPGITRQHQEKIFDPFFSTKERGTGLGLAVVQQIVQGCGGHIDLTSQPGHGACFEVWLPQCAPDAPSIGISAELTAAAQTV